LTCSRPAVANAIATYVLTDRTAAGADTTVARGPTSLVMRRAGGRWQIVHDHSS
jgi:ketosteroid isomerase-like protein